MRTRGWIVTAVAAGGLVLASRGCLDTASADQRLGQHLRELCDIARANVKSPEPGVRALGRYLDKHTGEMLGELGNTIAMIERIEDDVAHDQRARVARDRIQQPLRACEHDWKRFAAAVEADPVASKLVDRAAHRLNRTLEIVFGKGPAFQLRDLPSELDRALGRW